MGLGPVFIVIFYPSAPPWSIANTRAVRYANLTHLRLHRIMRKSPALKQPCF